MKKNGIFLFVISHLVPEIFKIFVLCKLGTDGIIRCVKVTADLQSAFRKMLCLRAASKKPMVNYISLES